MRTYMCYSCGRQFEKIVRGDGENIPCKRCKSLNTEVIPRSKAGVSLDHSPSTPTPQTTGASLADHDVDWVVDKNTQRILREMELRQDYKRNVLISEKTTGFHLSRLDNGEYFVMNEQERLAAKRARIQHQDVIKAINKTKKNE